MTNQGVTHEVPPVVAHRRPDAAPAGHRGSQVELVVDPLARLDGYTARAWEAAKANHPALKTDAELQAAVDAFCEDRS